ncbi:glycoside hydrolase family 13 protein [Pseudactinotalea sp. Z1739]|uniref:glycoside hydrolase family 13 protein n=1 Tax=Pseudactinotalea sp. Z1739 TaxID=3413028 RepID=UPI003C7B6C93
MVTASHVAAATTTTLVHRADQAPGWWRDAVIYQIYPRSFADSDGDGVGDLPGITGRLDHLARLGVDAVWLSPFYPSPQHDGGYDVADYRSVHPQLGTLSDMDALIARADQLGLRVIVDLVPNHTSDAHPWFAEALAAPPGSPERGRYIFRDGTGPDGAEPPNNWGSVFGGPGWTRITEADGSPGQWYLHLFDSHQPDLNWEHEEVRGEFIDVLRFWLDRGVAGFRVDVAHGLIKDQSFPEWEGHRAMISAEESAEHAGKRAPMWDQPRVHEIYRTWREVLAEYGPERVLIAEAWVEDDRALARYVRPDEMHQAFNFQFLTTPWRAGALRQSIQTSLLELDSVGAPCTWVLSNHDVVRAASRLGLSVTGKGPNGIGAGDPQPDGELGLRRARAGLLLMLALPGSAYLYQGEEFGLPEHTDLPDEVRQDPTFARTDGRVVGRDGCRIPLPWRSDAPGYGFSPTGATWLPQPESFAALAADMQKGDPSSTYELVRAALRIRRDWRLGSGSLAWVDGLPVNEGDLLVFTNREVVVLVNLGERAVPLPTDLEVLLASGGGDDVDHVGPDEAVWAVIPRPADDDGPH